LAVADQRADKSLKIRRGVWRVCRLFVFCCCPDCCGHGRRGCVLKAHEPLAPAFRLGPLCCVVPAPRRMLLVLLLLRCAFMGCFCRWGYSSVPRVAVSISLLLSARHCCLHISLKYQAIMIDASCMRHAPSESELACSKRSNP
jgi:hypothetical protein